MSNTFFTLLNLDSALIKKISVKKVISFSFNEKPTLKIYLETTCFLSAQEIKLLIKAFLSYKPIQNHQLLIDFFYLKLSFKNKLEIYELYEYILELIDLFIPNINKGNLHLENNDQLILKIADEDTYQKLLPLKSKLNLILKNFSLIKNDAQLLFLLDEEQIISKKELVKEIVAEKLQSSLMQKGNNVNSPYSGYKILNLDNTNEQEKVYFSGEVFHRETRATKRSNFFIHKFSIAKDNRAVSATSFGGPDLFENVQKDGFIRIYGDYKYNTYSKSMELKAHPNKYQLLSAEAVLPVYQDDILTPRAEMHLHTKMSTMDGISSIKEYVKQAKNFNLKAITIVDHNSAQAHPDGSNYISDDLKINFGVEFDIVNDVYNQIVINERKEALIDAEIIYFDLETTSLSPLVNEIIEFGGVKIRDGIVAEKLQLFIKPVHPVSSTTTQLTGITNKMLEDAISIKEALIIIKKFIGNNILVAHNAMFDYSFLDSFFRKNKLGSIKNPVIDSMKISWYLNPNAKNHRLGTLARKESIDYDNKIAHRADYDALILAKTFENILQHLYEKDIRDLIQLNTLKKDIKDLIFTNHLVIVAKNQTGLKTLYKLLSDASTIYFNKHPKRRSPVLPLSVLINIENRNDLVIGSSCARGMLWEAMVYDSSNIDEIAKLYDYIEVFPPSVYQFLIDRGFYTKNQINIMIKTMIEIGKRNNILVIASSDAHYATPEDKLIREIYIANKGLRGVRHPLYNWNNPQLIHPDQHLRSTTEMLNEFETFLTRELAKEIVITNSNQLNEMIDQVYPLKKKLYPPNIPSAEKDFLSLVKDNTAKLYGENVDKQILKRIKRELDAITEHGFSIVYYLSSLAVRKSMSDGYLVGSRGSVGSSIAATLSEITEVNPLKPHYRCLKCKYHEFDDSVNSGFDLQAKNCPKCKSPMIGDGHDIPFETFLGFNGDKVPDIDLNFSREYQGNIHQFIKKELGDKNVFRAGTISTVANKTAFGYVKNYLEQIGKSEDFSYADVSYLASRSEGVRRTSGQHPGGLIIIPQDKEVYDFTPVNFPGNDDSADWITTHFDFHSIHDNILKLDLLGHLDPSSIRMLQNLTKVDPQKIPMNDVNVISLFKNNNALNYIKNYTGEDLGIIGIPEFGTKFVRELVRNAKPNSFSDLIKISGLSHGTNVWTNNAKELIEKNVAKLSEVISVRDDIMSYLIDKGLKDTMSFQIMESVRKGKGLQKEWETAMNKNAVPQWYIDSCKKIKYMFPKAHATAYVIMAYRIAWYKINFPLEYYATFFTKRDTEWDLDSLYGGPQAIIDFQEEVKKQGWQVLDRDRNISETYDIVLEMLSRGYKILPISLKNSRTNNWIVDYEQNALIPPFSIVEGLGIAVASKLTKERNENMFVSLSDFKKRSSVNKTTLAKFDELGVLDELGPEEEENQITFDF